jgi:hypothetical protein
LWLFFFSTGNWTQGFLDRIPCFCLGWSWTATVLISTSSVARSTGTYHNALLSNLYSL